MLLQGKDDKTSKAALTRQNLILPMKRQVLIVTEDECLTTIGYEKLTPQDLTLVEQRRGWLNDRLINVGQIATFEE